MINAAPESPRYSDDVDIFHDVEESVAIAAADTEVLARTRYGVDWLVNRPGFQRAIISRDGQSLRLKWTQDSAFRFFPVQPDAEFGRRSHLADLATNKVLALTGRWEVRDFMDTLYLDGSFPSLGFTGTGGGGERPQVNSLADPGASQSLATVCGRRISWRCWARTGSTP